MTDSSKYNKELTESMVKLYEDNKSDILNQSSSLLNSFRADALAKFIQLGVPSFKNESYKYTRIDKAMNYKWKLLSTDTVCELSQSDSPKLDAYHIRFCNGKYCACEGQLELPEGVLIGSLKQVAEENPSIIKKYFNASASQSTDAFDAYNTVLTQDGLVVYIPEGIRLDKMLRISIGLCGDSAIMGVQRNLVILEKGAKASMLLQEHNDAGNAGVFNQLTEYMLAEEAELDINIIQDFSAESVFIDSQFYSLREKAQAHQTIFSLNAGVIRNNLKVDLLGEYAEMTINGMSILDGKQHVDNFTTISHYVPNCLSNQLYKNVLNGESSGVFAGKIHVLKDAQKTNAFQRNNNVLLSKEAKMYAKPQLIIDADDVKCSHGATVGQIDEDALFYMRARGLGERQARTMLMNAFCHEVIQEIKENEIQSVIIALAESKLNKKN
ncbi:MAG: Fe-S cluster assembly protein SufD [Mangrovibacterium sp.]